jgi:hypothetical protein
MVTTEQAKAILAASVKTERYCIRIELHKVDNEAPVYRRLHEAMERAGYVRVVYGNSSTDNIQLPHATYWKEAKKSINDIETEVNGIVLALHSEGSTVLVIKVAETRLTKHPATATKR